jgi:hypothetical protein
MAYGRPAVWRQSDNTVGGLFGVTKVRATSIADTRPGSGVSQAGTDPGAAVSEDAKTGMLLSHASFRQLFGAVSEGTYVGSAVAACYLGVSKTMLERRLDAEFGGVRPWRVALLSHQRAGITGPVMQAGKFRWSFISRWVDPLFRQEVADADARRCEKSRVARRRPPLRPTPLLRLADVIDSLLFVVDGRGRIVGALGQGHISAGMFIDVFNTGGRIESMSAIVALGREWTSLAARAPWEEAVRTLLALVAESVEGILARGAVTTERGGLLASRK